MPCPLCIKLFSIYYTMPCSLKLICNCFNAWNLSGLSNILLLTLLCFRFCICGVLIFKINHFINWTHGIFLLYGCRYSGELYLRDISGAIAFSIIFLSSNERVSRELQAQAIKASWDINLWETVKTGKCLSSLML